MAAETWRLMAGFTFTKFQGSEHVAILRGLGLTPGHMKALSLQADARDGRFSGVRRVDGDMDR